MSSTIDDVTRSRITDVYGHVPDVLADGLKRCFDQSNPPSTPDELWDHRDVVMITYADQIREPGKSPLDAQRQFLLDHNLDELIRCVHLLPFCPSTSDDGFSVADYLAVDPESGDWDDIKRLGERFDLMYDLVLNHSSQHHRWFQGFLNDEPEYKDFYATADPSEDLSEVVRPRSLPLLTEFDSASGKRHVWTTFSADQVDLNYANPHVMLAMLETLVEYARRGARIIRLDAIAFLWKEIGTSCLHLPQTHAAVRLMRHVLDVAAPGTIVLTETNVPHAENISYFGDGTDEAHMVYQFSLPPLLLDAIHSGDTGVLQGWMRSLDLPTDQVTYFNFTASHDGIGVRPAEGILPQERVDALVDVAKAHGGRIGMRTKPDGSQSPYELNITYLDAIADRTKVPAAEHAQRFLATQAIMLSMAGVPAVYFHSLVGSPNDIAGVEASGIPRRINRHKYERAELEAALSETRSLQQLVADGYRHLLRARKQQTQFHPNASQTVLELPTDGLLGFVRQHDDQPALCVLANLSGETRSIASADLPGQFDLDVLSDESLDQNAPIAMAPYQVRWLKSSSTSDS
ncbi:alpha amylase, catalytic region [Rhodopirellula baltica SH28]|uniref:Alpha amylase, catalytic region n=1 Tax=Rhodopirellula baltica SH28 TaxID=993517 RepID=K5CBG4_RHOBT|nr:alpha-amylase family glycosyl hydrolase [Rhodopirellula baltica]EKK00725.1 alpha amylase, catalytic region [Rhodopirellula baltica SH28]